jgi:putative ABC transport system permease protein
MLKSLRFALLYALRSMLRDRQRAAFSVLSIAAGVATVVALRTLGLMLTDALTNNAQAFLRGDVRMAGRGNQLLVAGLDGSNQQRAFNEATIRAADAWAVRNNVQITYTMLSELMQVSTVRNGQNGAPAFAIANFIDPQVFPFYDIIRAEEPVGVELKDLLTGPNQIAIGRRLADQLGAKIGDTIRLSSTEQEHTLVGIVPDTAESSFENVNAIFFSFIYLDRAYLTEYGLAANIADRAYIKLPEGTDQDAFRSRQLQAFPDAANNRGFRITTSTEVLRSNRTISEFISRFALLMSLMGLVIGGVGIINTMLVAVNRRSGEIAVLKVMGLKGRGVSLVFLTEAVLLGLLGGLAGGLLGVVLSRFVRDFSQQGFGIPLPWRFYPEALLLGIVLGMLITVFFAVLPTLTAGKIRPALVLRAGAIPIMRAGVIPSLISFVILVVGLGVIVDLILDSRRFNNFNMRLPAPLTPGIIGVFGVFMLLLVILFLMWLVVWILSKLPNFRNANIKIALRGLSQYRVRTALSLMALLVGMTALSSTLIGTRAITRFLATSISEPLGGNMIIVPILPVEGLINSRLTTIEGVESFRNVRVAEATLVAVNGQREPLSAPINGDDAELVSYRVSLQIPVGMRLFGQPQRSALREGRYLTEQDAGQRVMTVPYHPYLDTLGVKVGSTLTYRFNRVGAITYTVVGIVEPLATAGVIPFSLADGAVQAPIDSIPQDLPFDLIVAQVQPENLQQALGQAAFPGVFVIDVSIFDSIISRLLTQIATLPLIVAALSLFAASALIATTVSLATMERRRQIGIMKAVGVKRRQVLSQLLLENGLIGLVGGLLSVLPTILILALIPTLTQNFVRLPMPVDIILVMLGLSILVTLVATLLTAWGASGEKPLSVLRYE